MKQLPQLQSGAALVETRFTNAATVSADTLEAPQKLADR